MFENNGENGLIYKLKEEDEITYHLTEKGHSLNKVFYELFFSFKNSYNIQNKIKPDSN